MDQDQNTVQTPPMQEVPPASVPPVVTNSSKGLSIAALVLAIIAFVTGFLAPLAVPLAIVSLILAIVSLAKHRGGKGLSIAALIISGLVVIVSPLLFIITLVAYNGISTRANDNAAKADAYAVQKVAEVYASESDTASYPASAEILANYKGLSQIPTSISLIGVSNECTDASSIMSCLDKDSTVMYVATKDAMGACIAYYSKSLPGAEWSYVGDASSFVYKPEPICQ